MCDDNFIGHSSDEHIYKKKSTTKCSEACYLLLGVWLWRNGYNDDKSPQYHVEIGTEIGSQRIVWKIISLSKISSRVISSSGKIAR